MMDGESPFRGIRRASKKPCARRQARPGELLAPSEGNRSSSRPLRFLDRGSLLQFSFHMSDHLAGVIEGACRATFFQILLGLIQTGIDDAALRRSVLVVGVGKLGTVDDQLRREHDLASVHGRLHQIAVGDSDGGAQAAWQRHLSLTMDSNESSHKVRKSESQTSDGRIAETEKEIKHAPAFRTEIHSTAPS